MAAVGDVPAVAREKVAVEPTAKPQTKLSMPCSVGKSRCRWCAQGRLFRAQTIWTERSAWIALLTSPLEWTSIWRFALWLTRS